LYLVLKIDIVEKIFLLSEIIIKLLIYYQMKMSGKEEVLKEAFVNIEKQFWKGAIMRMGDNSNVWLVNTNHTGSYVLDLIIGWGFPEWRVVEVYGPESSGKTTLALHAVAEIQKKWWIAAFIDAEHALDPQYAKRLGVDVDNLLLSQPDYWEQALQIAQELAKSWAVKIIVIDSVAALTPRAEVEWDMWDSHMWLQARMMSQWLRKLTSILAKTGTTCVFINQIRMKIGLVFGNPETTTGGNALKFYASQRIEIRRWDKILEEKEQVGYLAKIKIAKNKISAPFKKAELPVRRNIWYDKNLDIIEAWMILKLVTRSGAFYTIWDKKVQGKEKFSLLLSEDPKLRNSLEKEIQVKIKEMRSWKQVLDDEILEKVEKIMKEEWKSKK